MCFLSCKFIADVSHRVFRIYGVMLFGSISQVIKQNDKKTTNVFRCRLFSLKIVLQRSLVVTL